ncbi:MAG TPA: hypothetical protein VF650_09395 [Allosphingosinicella sp.]|jgi:hypothetical protein
MELEFTADGAGADGELFIHLDVDGLAALLGAVEAAMTQGRGELITAARGAAGTIGRIGPKGGFGKVTVTFEGDGNPGERRESGAWLLPEAAPASLQIPANS